MCSFPQLIAAYHVFHRLLVPRHSPYALSSLTYLHFREFSLIFTKKSPLLKICLTHSFYGLIVFFMNTLVYLKIYLSIYFSMCSRDKKISVVEIKGVEPLTSCLQGRRSSQLSYIPRFNLKCTKSTFKNKQ